MRLAQVTTGQIGSRELPPTFIDHLPHQSPLLVQFGPVVQPRTAQIRPPQVGFAEVGPSQIGPPQVRSPQVPLAQIGPGKVGPRQVAATLVHDLPHQPPLGLQSGVLVQSRLAELAPPQVGPLQIRPAQVCAA